MDGQDEQDIQDKNEILSIYVKKLNMDIQDKQDFRFYPENPVHPC